MKKTQLYTNVFTTVAMLIFFMHYSYAQNIFPTSGAAGIGTTTPNASALLDIVSTTQGMLTPRMTVSQRDLIDAPAKGLLIYQTDSLPGFYYYNGSGWVAVTTAKGANTFLSNLTAPTAVNVNLLPGTDNSINLGSSALKWKDVNLYNLKFSNGTVQNTAFAPYTAGTGISVNSGNVITNTSPDQIVALTGTGGTTITGIYPNFTVNSSALAGWSLTGNSGTTPSKNFIGTTDLQPLVFKVNNQKAGLIESDYGSGNTAFGDRSLKALTTGTHNTAIGTRALPVNTLGYQNTAIGVYSLFYNTNGSDNTANGFGALYKNETGNYNTAVGRYALAEMTSGTGNTALGAFADVATGMSNATAIGGNTFANCSNCMVLGSIKDFNGFPATIKIGIGMTNPTRAIIEQNGSVGTTAAIFGGDGAGISLQKDWPAIGFNEWYDDGGSHRSIGAGFSAQLGVNQVTGSLYLATWNQRRATGGPNGLLNPSSLRQRFFISQSGKVGIGGDNPQSDLDITMNGEIGGDGTYFHAHNGLRLNHPSNGYYWNLGFHQGALDDGALNLYFNAAWKGGFRALDGTYYTVSDKNLKTEINDLPNGMLKKVLALKPANYFMIDDKVRDAKSYGFIAQDVEKIFPEFVKKIDTNTKGLTYAYFIPVLTKAIQELSVQNDSLKSDNNTLASVNNKQQQQIDNLQLQLNNVLHQLSELKTAQQQCCANTSLSQPTVNSQQSIILNNDAARLEQNAPNPFNNNTVIKYYVPSNITNAQLLITDVSGHVLKSVAIGNKGAGQTTVSAGTLSSGSYFYSLIIDGKKVDTKQMILTK